MEVQFGEENFLQNTDDPNFDKQYVAKLLHKKDNLQQSNLVAMISYRNPAEPRLHLAHIQMEQLEKARSDHLLVYKEPYIYMIGGVVNGQYTRSCQKFHLGEKIWVDFASIPFIDKLEYATAIACKNYIYVFDAYSINQIIFKVGILNLFFVKI